MMKTIMMVLVATNVVARTLTDWNADRSQKEEVVVHTETKNAEEVNIVIVVALGLAKTKKNPYC